MHTNISTVGREKKLYFKKSSICSLRTEMLCESMLVCAISSGRLTDAVNTA